MDANQSRKRPIVDDKNVADLLEAGPSKRKAIDGDGAASVMELAPTILGAAAPVISEKGAKMMAKMGYEEGKGLGKYQQGRTEIVKESTHKGRRGLGVEPTGFETNFEKTWTEEDVVISENVKWISYCAKGIPTLDTMHEWLKIGPKKRTIGDETDFVDEKVLADVLSCKSVFDNLENKEMRTARTKSNPFETIQSVFFQNRAAMKMANMDSVFDFLFTNPKKEDGTQLLSSGDVLYFADVAAGPGGFSEYVLWRRFHCNSGAVKGFGFTLKGPCDFKLHDFYAAPVEFFETYYGVPRPGTNDLDGDGDLTRPENLEALRKVVMDGTGGEGVHFMMADGGFSVEGNENIQEILSKQLYLCQFIAAMGIVRTGGAFVCKLFDLFTSFSVGLVYLMWRSFDNVTIHKPVTSRPANSERYIVCKGKRAETEDVYEYLFHVNKELGPLMSDSSTKDVVEVVPAKIIRGDEAFFNYIRESNDELGLLQVLHLKKIRAFAQNPNLIDARQKDIRGECLAIWRIPSQIRQRPERHDAYDLFTKLMSHDGAAESFDYLMMKAPNLDSAMWETRLCHVRDYSFIVAGRENEADRVFLLGLGRNDVRVWNGHSMNGMNPKWSKPSFKLELPQKTLLLAEIVKERVGEGKGQRIFSTVHVIDALFVSGVDVRAEDYRVRMSRARVMTRALTKHTNKDLTPIRTKTVYDLTKLKTVLKENFSEKVVKGCGGTPRWCYQFPVEVPFSQYRSLLPTSLLLIRTSQEPWISAFSKTNKSDYWFNVVNGESTYKRPSESIASFKTCLKSGSFSVVWPNGLGAYEHKDVINQNAFLTFIENKLNCR